MIDLSEAKTYLRVDSSDEDSLIESLIETATQHVKDMTRLTDKAFEKQESREKPKKKNIAHLQQTNTVIDEIGTNRQLRLFLKSIS